MIARAPLNAKDYAWGQAIYCSEFEQLLLGCFKAYKTLVAQGIICSNNENKIRDALVSNYLECDDFKAQTYNLASYHFEAETVEGIEGRADIKILPVNPYRGQKAYYLIECKRLDAVNLLGRTGLNAEYVKNGICRFVSGYYSSFYHINGMFGFIVSKLDVDANIAYLNRLLPQTFCNARKRRVCANAIQPIQKTDIGESCAQCYTSKHIAKDNDCITLYHLMLDFSNNISL